MTGTLKYTLVVKHPETGEPTALLEGQPVPSWASGLVHKDDVEGAAPKRAAKSESAKSKS